MRVPKLIPLPKAKAATPGRAGDNKNWIMLLIALIVGVAGMYLAHVFIQKRVAAYEAQIKGDMTTISVVVPKEDLPTGTLITADNVAIRELPIPYVHRDAVTPEKFEVAEGQRLSFQLDKGKPLLWAHLEGGAAPTFSGKLPNGKRAMTIPVDEINSISGMLQPKDRIDLLLTMNRNGNKVTLPLLQDVLVLATGTRLDGDKIDPRGAPTASKTYRTATLLVSQEEAKKIVLAQDAGKLTAILRHPEDENSLPNEQISVANLLNEGGPPKRSTPSGPGVEIILGGKGR